MLKTCIFELICSGLQTKPLESISLDIFSKMSLKDWQALKEIADKQGVSVIVLDGLVAVVEAFGKEKVAPFVDEPQWRTFVFKWVGNMVKVEQRNQHQTDVLNDLASQWVAHGCRVMIMKGQANGMVYPRPDHRSVGDIDCYLFDDYAKGNDIARRIGAGVNESWYKHSVIGYKGETFENHCYFVHTRDGKNGKRLEKELEDALKVEQWEYFSNNLVVLPPIQWTAMFLTYHACAHFLSEGLRLKQLLDWAMFLQKYQNDVNWSDFYGYCERYHLRRFAVVVTAISIKYLGVKITNTSIVTESPYVDKFIHSMLYDNEYVFNSGKRSWYNRWHLVRNLFNHRWKYEEIYQRSIYIQLWWYVTGFLLKTEQFMYKVFLKRFLDFWLSLIVLICISPVLFIVYILLSLLNKGAGALFFQERPGKDGKIFKVIKFKTMTDERDSKGNLLPDAQRLTKVGKFVRSTSLDELPQLINVLKGDMALIGPRPLMPAYLPLYSKEQARRHEVRPGISGWAQCHGRNSISWTEKFKLDVWYVDHCTLWTDIKIIFITIKKVFIREGINFDGAAELKAFDGTN